MLLECEPTNYKLRFNELGVASQRVATSELMSCDLWAKDLPVHHIANQQVVSLPHYELRVGSQEVCELQPHETWVANLHVNDLRGRINPLSTNREFSKRVLQENKSRQIFRKTNNFLPSDTHTCVNEGLQLYCLVLHRGCVTKASTLSEQFLCRIPTKICFFIV